MYLFMQVYTKTILVFTVCLKLSLLIQYNNSLAMSIMQDIEVWQYGVLIKVHNTQSWLFQ